jgi:hypothetical protein
MLPAPAAIAAAPITSSRPSWNPAVPPPPVTGGWLGTGLGDGLGLEVAVTVAVAVWVGVTVTVVVTELGDAPSLAELLLAKPLPEEVSELIIVKEDSEGTVDPLPEQAERVAIPSRIRAPQLTAVSLALSAALPIVVGTFIEPPHARFSPPRRQKTRTGKKARGRPDRLPVSAEDSRRRPQC